MCEDMPRAKTVSDDRLLAAMDEVDVPSPVVTVSDLCEVIDLKRDAVRTRLKNLENEGLVESRQVGARAAVWWRPEWIVSEDSLDPDR